MAQRQSGLKKSRTSEAMNDETIFDPLFWVDSTNDTRLELIQESLTALEEKAAHAVERILPRPLANKFKKISGF
jgi:hypothetical protein